MALFRSLSYRSFALLWSGQTISRLGDSLYQIGLAWWVLERTGSAATMGAVFVFSFAPMLLFLLIGGVTVDRLPRLRIMLASDVLRGVLVAVVALLAAGDRLEIWHVYLASVLFGLVDAFFQPAYAAVMPELAPRDALTSANSLSSLSGQTIGVVGPALGAAIVKAGGSQAVFAIDAATFLVSAACILSIPPHPAPRAETHAQASFLADAREGLRTVMSIPWVWVWIAISTVLNLTWGAPMIVALPFLVTKTLRADVGGLGLVYSLMSLGAVLGAVGVGQLGQIRRRGLVVCGSWLLAGAALAALSWPIGLWWVAACALAISASGAINNVIGSVVMQEYIPAELLGRVSSIGALGSYALLPVGLGLIGWATDLAGAPLVFLIGGALTVALGLFGLSRSAMRSLV